MRGPTWEPIVNAEHRSSSLKEKIDKLHHTEDEKFKIIEGADDCLRTVMEDFSEHQPRYQRDIVVRYLRELVELMDYAEQKWTTSRPTFQRQFLDSNFFPHYLRMISNAAESYIQKIIGQS